jgi:hypothetical protein
MSFSAINVVEGRVFVFAESLGGVNNINIYGPTGAILVRTGLDTLVAAIRNICSTYDNFVSITKETNLDDPLADFENYKEL